MGFRTLPARCGGARVRDLVTPAPAPLGKQNITFGMRFPSVLRWFPCCPADSAPSLSCPVTGSWSEKPPRPYGRPSSPPVETGV